MSQTSSKGIKRNLNKFATSLAPVRKTLAHIIAILFIGMTSALTTTSAHAVFNSLPIADPDGPYSIYLGDSLVVNGSASFDPDAPFGDYIAGYQWDFFANGSVDGTGMIHTFSAADLASAGISSLGTYSLKLNVSDSFGESGFQVTSLEVLAPAAAIPEPMSLVLLGVGLAGLALTRRRRSLGTS